nr:AMP-binding protein [Sphingosinicella soli]
MRAAIAAHPDREAVIFEARRLTYAELGEAVDQMAAALLASGVQPGDRVALLSTSRLEFWVHFLATTAIGAIWLGLGIRNTLEELRHVVADAEPVLLFGIANFEKRDYRSDLAELARMPSVRELIVLGGGAHDVGTRFEDWLAAGDKTGDAVATAAARIAPADPALIVYTSGTTGKPKGAVLSHHGMVTGNRRQGGRYLGITPREICSLPINHIACVGDTCASNLMVGGTIVLTERFVPREQLEIIERERINLWGGIPAMVQMVLNDPDFAQFDVSSVKLTGWGGAAMPRETIERLGALGETVGVVYGLTETTANVCWSVQGADVETLAGSIGRAVPEFPCRIAREDGTECDTGEAGEIQFRASTNMIGYWRRPEATREAFTEDGWLRTGDMGVLRADGYIMLSGRRIEAFKSGGFNVYPREVEQALEQNPAVRFAAVVPVPHPLYGEVGHAFVVATNTALTTEALLAHARTLLAGYKVPRSIEFMAELPLLPNGKIDKAGLRARAAAA